MSLVAPYVDGKLQTSTTSSDSLTKSSDKNAVDSDTFLTLLVAEMQNQDPLEPTSNTEWVSQYATFTQVQQMSEMSDSMDLIRANSLIGKEVVMKVTSETTGETNYKRGKVDYVVVEDGKPLVVIDEAKYSISDLDTVASDEYFAAYDKYAEFKGKLAALPSLALMDKSYENTVKELYDLYHNLSDYEKNYLETFAAGDIESYKAYLDKMKQFGINFEEKQEEQPATLDDILDSFNKKMSALMEQLDGLKEKVESSGSSGGNSGGATANTGNTTDNKAGNAGNVTDNAGNVTDNTGNVTDNAGNAADNAGNATDNDSRTDDNNSVDGNPTGNTGDAADDKPVSGVGDTSDNASDHADNESEGSTGEASENTADHTGTVV